MEAIKGKHLGGFTLMPAKEGTCPECAVNHEPELPHDAKSMFYQYKFYNEHGRFPAWNDAIAHCEDDVKMLWVQSLREHGVEI